MYENPIINEFYGEPRRMSTAEKLLIALMVIAFLAGIAGLIYTSFPIV